MSALAVVAVVLAVAALVLLSGWVVWARQRARDERVQVAGLEKVVTQVRWIHDIGTLAVLEASAEPERLEGVWGHVGRQLKDAAARASVLASGTRDDDLRDHLRGLSRRLSRLTRALDTHVNLHSEMAGDPTLTTALEGSVETVMQRRADLAASLEVLAVRGGRRRV